MISSGRYNNSFIEGDWSISFGKDSVLNDGPRLWHYCSKEKIIRCYTKDMVQHRIPRKAICHSCKVEPSETFITTFLML